jgi:hypothetical protein
MKKVTMSISQFMEMERGNLTVNEIIKENGLETPFEKIVNNDDFKYAVSVAILATVCAIANPTVTFATTAIPASSLSTEQIVTVPKPEILLNVIKNITYGTCAFAGIHEVRAAIKNRFWKSIPSEVLKYGLAFCTVYFADDFFKLILETIPNLHMPDVTLAFSSMMEQVAYSNSLDILRQI